MLKEKNLTRRNSSEVPQPMSAAVAGASALAGLGSTPSVAKAKWDYEIDLVAVRAIFVVG